jgi:asparagine synthase (glutamine-hydrolysing)
MCGIAGILSTDPTAISRERLKKMADALAHRGPDGEAYWINDTGKIGLAHRRLAIIDLSPEAAQPMHYLNRYTIIYNGEIYNYLELKEDLINRGYNFRTRSDTEVILAAYDFYQSGCLEHFDGMFAFAIWDQQEQTIFAARDRFGEKPFYYSFTESQFYFASEKKALWAVGIEKKINHPLLLNFLVTGHTQTAADNSISFHQDIFSLPPAHYLLFRLPSFSFDLTCYWDLDKEATVQLSPNEACEKWKELFFKSVSRRLRSDVAVGTSLSGGLDSSSILAAISTLAAPNLKQHANDSSAATSRVASFSAIFPGFSKDESRYISLVKEKLDLDNFPVFPGAEGLLTDFEQLCQHQEEPFSSSSLYAQYKVFERARQSQVKVLLDGQGADETHAGYNKYIHWFLQERLRTNTWKHASEVLVLKKNNMPFQWGWKNYLAALLPAQAADQLERREARKIKRQPYISDAFCLQNFDRPSIYKPIVFKLNDILYFDTCRFGLEELLRYADRNSMAHGVETRLPFLNHELVQFLFSLPSQLKINQGWTKWIIRQSMAAYLPAEIIWRKDKVGFETPQKSWMENPGLVERIQEARRKLVQQGILQSAVLNKKIQPHDAHAADNYDWRYLVAAAFV